MDLAKKTRKAPVERVPSTAVSAEEMDVEDSFEESSNLSLPLETVSAASDQASPSFTVDQDHADASDNGVIRQLQQKITLLELKLADCEESLREVKSENEILLSRQFSLEKIKDDNSAILFYTGFPSYEALISFFKYIEPKLEKMQYWKGERLVKGSQPYQEDENRKKPGPSRKLSFLDEFLLVLMRLKAGLFVQDLADRFGVSISLVSRICITWINLLYYELKDIFPFPTQELVRKNMPEEFAEFATTRIILDCTELFIQRPSAMLAQSETWSDYKHHNTWKLLVGVTPNGQVSFLSDLWGGRVSDKQITRESGVLDLIESGDNIMVDRGFDIKDIVPEGVTVNMPPFLAGRNQLTAAETEETMTIASVRIHVERAIGRIKTYHILDGNLPNTLSPYATQIATVCGLLTNFLPPLLMPANPKP